VNGDADIAPLSSKFISSEGNWTEAWKKPKTQNNLWVIKIMANVGRSVGVNNTASSHRWLALPSYFLKPWDWHFHRWSRLFTFLKRVVVISV